MQAAAVTVIVALAVVYVTWKLMPRAVRVRIVTRLVGWARSGGRLDDDAAARLARRMTAGGCGSCDSCGTCSPKDAAASDASVLRYLPHAAGSDVDRRRASVPDDVRIP